MVTCGCGWSGTDWLTLLACAGLTGTTGGGAGVTCKLSDSAVGTCKSACGGSRFT